MVYKPIAVPMKDLQEYFIELDEFEVMRLCDLEGMGQEEAGEKMGISRGTVQRLLDSGRKKLLGAILVSAAIRIKNK
ncbi:MAG: DUF134 domain-containing protein [Bacillota bacterium]